MDIENVMFTDSQASHPLTVPLLKRYEDLSVFDDLFISNVKPDGSNIGIIYKKTTKALSQTDRERQANTAEYARIKNELYEKHLGKFAVIAKGKLQQIGDSFDEVKNVALDANHRFIFQVEREDDTKRILIWPKRPVK